MCGFHGSTGGRPIARDSLAHRGPDSYGVYRDGSVVLQHWRLSIIDLSDDGAQPMAVGDDASLVIAYNGEVYNFSELRKELPDTRFTSGTDTEVVLRLYERYGLDCLPKLDGMFAFAIYDKKKRQIVLARDRFGIKPIYYYVDAEKNLAFASELKSLMLGHPIAPTLDKTAIQSLFHLLYIEGERTPFADVRKLPPGSWLVYDLDSMSWHTARYHRISFVDHDEPEPVAVQRVDDLLADSVRMHLISDVPVGALLSGGVDSSLMVALMSRYTDEVHTYSVGYADSSFFDESKYFNQVAEMYRTDHHHTVVHQERLDGLVDTVCSVLDEPLGDTSVFLNFFIFGFVSESVKVCLSGLGGDELFGGYNRYLACKLLPVYTNLPGWARGAMERLISGIPSSRHGRLGNRVRLIKTFLRNVDENLGRSYCKFIDYLSHTEASPVVACDPFENSRFDAYWDEEAVDGINRIYKYDIENYTVNDLLLLADRMSMQHSLEVRVPYLENELVDYALGIAPKRKIRRLTMKYLLKKVAERHIPKDVIYRRKQGFSSPITGLLSPARLDALRTELEQSDEQYVCILNRRLFSEMIESHSRGRDDYSLQIFTLLVYMRWMRHMFDQIGVRAFEDASGARAS